MIELLIQLEPSMYCKYIITGPKWEPIVYVKLQKALCGLLRAALLFYKKLRGNLEDIGFKSHPYDPCVGNKRVDGSKITVMWHVDNLKVSHKESTEAILYVQ